MRVTIHEVGPRDGYVKVLRGHVGTHYMIDGVAYSIEEYAGDNPERDTRFALVHPDLKRKMLGA